MKLLLTSGATRESIDEVRFITNFSSGNSGAFLSDYMTDQKHDVTVLLGQGAEKPRYAKNIISFTSFSDLDTKMKRLLAANKFDGVIHLAAVSDYSVSSIETGG